MRKHTTRTHIRRWRLRDLAVPFVAVVGLVAASCGSDDGGGTSEGGPPTVEITSPADGAQVGESFDVDLAVNFPIGEPDTGRDHVHLYYDGNTAEGEYGIVYEDSFTVEGLDPGDHTIEAVVAHADHSLTDTRSAPITVHVGEGGAAEPAPPTTAEDGGIGY